ncbi:MAG: HTTM domain-containing protein [Balneolales bacterium]|nr:HTTM domain-containing protein [Balneolales bacterium]
MCNKQVSASSLGLFRILFGAVLAWKSVTYLTSGLIPWLWVYPDFNFYYGFFSWVKAFPEPVLYGLFVILLGCAFCIITGFLFRMATTAAFIIQLYFFLLEQAHYLNHEYLVLIINLLLIFIPADRCYSIKNRSAKNTIAFGYVLLLQLQIGLVYFFGGIAKINTDWLNGAPMNIWLPEVTDFPVLGPFFAEQSIALIFSYSGLIIDLVALPLLLLPKTRSWMAIILLGFHLMNDRLFQIGIFPWFMIASLVLYFRAGWPEAVRKKFMASTTAVKGIYTIFFLAGGFSSLFFHEGISAVPFLVTGLVFVMLFSAFDETVPQESELITKSSAPADYIKPGLMVFFSIWLFFQIVVPLRHFTIPGNPSWTEEGHRFSWQMKLRTKSCTDQFYTWDFEKEELKAIPRGYKLWEWQHDVMVSRPHMILQYANVLSKAYDNGPIFADISCSLNGNPPRRLLDRTTDLTRVRFTDYRQNSWINR